MEGLPLARRAPEGFFGLRSLALPLADLRRIAPVPRGQICVLSRSKAMFALNSQLPLTLRCHHSRPLSHYDDTFSLANH